MSYPLMTKERTKPVKSLKIQVLIDEIVNDEVLAVPPSKAKYVTTPSQLKDLKIVETTSISCRFTCESLY